MPYAHQSGCCNVTGDAAARRRSEFYRRPESADGNRAPLSSTSVTSLSAGLTGRCAIKTHRRFSGISGGGLLAKDRITGRSPGARLWRGASSLRSGVYFDGGFRCLFAAVLRVAFWVPAAVFVCLRVRVVFLLRVFRLPLSLDERSSSASPLAVLVSGAFSSALTREAISCFTPAPGFRLYGFPGRVSALRLLFPRLPCRDDKRPHLHSFARTSSGISLSATISGQLVQHGDIA